MKGSSMPANEEEWTVDSILAAKRPTRPTLQERAAAAVAQEKQDKLDEAAQIRQECKDHTPELLVRVLELEWDEACSVEFEDTAYGSLDRVVFFNYDGIRFRVDFSNYDEREARLY